MTRGRWILATLVVASLIAGALAYKQWPHLLKRFRQSPQVTTVTSDQPSSTPPFSTREPERYQAARVITEIEKAADGAQSAPLVEKLLIARDGQNRREEFRGSGGLMVYLDTAAGQFLLLPEKKLYAPATPAGAENVEVSPATEITNFSPERLLHETSATAVYQKLGAEALAGRATTKYRVIEGNNGDQPEETMTLIWVDDELGLPVKTETSSNSAIMTIELKDIRREVDPQLFELPKDYKKVDFATLNKEKSGAGGQPGAKSKAP